MIHLLFSVILGEACLALLLLFRTPLRKLVIMALDRVKRGRGPVVVKTAAALVLVVFLSSVFGMAKIRARSFEGGVINPTDEVLMARHLLEASLMGFILFLSLMIDRLHHYIRELRVLRKTMEAGKKQNRFSAGDEVRGTEVQALKAEIASLRAEVASKEHESEAKGKDATVLREEIAGLKKKMETLGLECQAKTDEARAAEANAEALKKQSEGFLLEYDRLLEDNQNLRNQLQALDPSFVPTDNKKMR